MNQFVVEVDIVYIYSMMILVVFSIQTDAWFEVISIVMQMAIWHTKHAANIAASDRCVAIIH